MSTEKHILIDYTNHARVRQVREILPAQIKFDSTAWHPETQWLLDAFDIGKNAVRTFAVKDINRWGVQPDRQMQIDLSISAQLQRSMERNARMSNRIKKVGDILAGLIGETIPGNSEVDEALRRILAANAAIDAILKDEEPTWPAA